MGHNTFSFAETASDDWRPPLFSGNSAIPGRQVNLFIPRKTSGALIIIKKSMRENLLILPAFDAFAHPFWNTVRDTVSNKAMGTRRQGFFDAAMLPMAELEYTGIMEKLKVLDTRFRLRCE